MNDEQQRCEICNYPQGSFGRICRRICMLGDRCQKGGPPNCRVVAHELHISQVPENSPLERAS